MSKILFSFCDSATVNNDSRVNLLSNISTESNVLDLDENVTELTTDLIESVTENAIDDNHREQRVHLFRPLFVYRQEQAQKQNRVKPTVNPDRNGAPSKPISQTSNFQPWPGTYIPSSDGSHYIYYPNNSPPPPPPTPVSYVEPIYVYKPQQYQSSAYYPYYYEHKYPTVSSNQYYWPSSSYSYWPSSSSNYHYSYSSPSSYSSSTW